MLYIMNAIHYWIKFNLLTYNYLSKNFVSTLSPYILNLASRIVLFEIVNQLQGHPDRGLFWLLISNFVC